MKSIGTQINDTAIKTYAKDGEIGELRDSRNPISLKFHKSREKATWCYLHYVGGVTKRTRIGYWPTLKTKEAAALIPTVIESIHKGKEIQSTSFKTVLVCLNTVNTTLKGSDIITNFVNECITVKS